MKQGQKVLTGLALAALFAAAPGELTAYAAGWTDDGGSWKYITDDGTVVTDQWKKSGDDWYYLDSDGRMMQNSLIQVDDDYFYVDGDGKRVLECWMSFEPESDNDYGMQEYWYYFGTDGKALRKKGGTFKKTVNGSVYIFDEDGIMLTGFINEDGDWIEDDDEFIDARYYCSDDGVMYQNRWLKYDYQSDGQSDLRSDMAEKDYMDYDAVWLYFDSQGKKVKSSSTEKITQRVIDGATYGFDENGVMMSWWSKTAEDSRASEKFYSGHDGGQLLKSTWVWMYPSEEMDADDYNNQEYSWWRTDDNGKVYRNQIREIEGSRYAFDDIGRMQTGFLLYDGTKNFVFQHDIDTYSSDDFKEGTVLGIEKADLYLFGPDELNGGSMLSGKEFSVELADGIYTFGFRSNGRAYGSRNKLEKNDDCYYINGLRLEATNELKYAVVKVNDDEYRVVNDSGKIVKGSKKLVSDGGDGWYIVINDKFKGYVIGEKPKWYKGDAGEGYYRYDKDNKTYGELLASKDSEVYDGELQADARLNYE